MAVAPKMANKHSGITIAKSRSVAIKHSESLRSIHLLSASPAFVACGCYRLELPFKSTPVGSSEVSNNVIQ